MDTLMHTLSPEQKRHGSLGIKNELFGNLQKKLFSTQAAEPTSFNPLEYKQNHNQQQMCDLPGVLHNNV